MAKREGTKLGIWQKEAARGGICQRHKKYCPSLTVEHIIPVHILQELGLGEDVYDDEENFEMWCKNCNGMKGSRLDVFHPKTIPLLKKYIGLAEEIYGHTV